MIAAGTAVWAAVVLGVPAVRSGALAAVMLAVVVLIPLAAHEVFSGLAPAAQEMPRLRMAGARVASVLAQPDPVAEPADTRPGPRRPLRPAGPGADGALGGGRPGRAARS